MKKNINTTILISITILSLWTASMNAQPPAPPVLPDQHGWNGDFSVQAAPLDRGVTEFFVLGLIYLAGKMIVRKKTNQ